MVLMTNKPLMKRILLFVLLFLSAEISAQQSQFGMYIPTDIPFKADMPYMSTNVGFGLSGGYSFASSTPFYLEFKSSWGSYSSTTLSQTYSFSNGTQTNVNVDYRSSMHKYLLGTKWMIGNSYKTIRGYVTPQVGLANFRSRIVIADPQDEDDCQALERRTTQKFAGFVYGGELGAEIAMEHIFKKIQQENTHKIILSLNYLAGFKHFEYVNIRYMMDEVHGEHTMNDDRDINAQFINVSTNAIHEHKIAELYHSPLRFWGFNIGYVVKF